MKVLATKSNKLSSGKTGLIPQQGLSLIGVLISTVLIGMTLTAGLASMTRSIRSSSVAKNEITASGLAEEGVELVKNIRDAGDYWAQANAGADDGFTRLENLLGGVTGPKNIALDYRVRTYGATPAYPDYGDMYQPEYRNETAGLCLRHRHRVSGALCSGSPIPANCFPSFEACPLSDPDLEFIRKIELEKGGGGCKGSDPNALGVSSTVYWVEDWERADWPTTISNATLTDDNNPTLHRVRVLSCLYNWR